MGAARWFFCSVWLICACVPLTSSSRILFLLPISSKSMANVFEPLAVELAQRGHQLTIVSSTKFKIPESNHNVSQLMPMSADEIFKSFPGPFEIRRRNSIYSFPTAFILKQCHILYENQALRKVLSESFDVIVLNLYYHDCFAGSLHKMGAPIVQIASAPLPSYFVEMFGTDQPSSFVPIVMNSDFSHQMSFRQRTINFLYNAHFSIQMAGWVRPPMEEFYREQLSDPGLPSVLDVFQRQTSIVLVNAHHAITRVRPTLPNIIDIGGIHCRPGGDLPPDLEEFVQGAENGVIVFSLGSIVKATQMPEVVRLTFLSVFSKLTERVIWKWEKQGGMEGLPENVKVVKWLPQQDLLAHPKTKLFITHGGLLSTEEAVYHGIPVLGMPIFADQDANMKQAELLGFGVKGEILDITEEKLAGYIHRILHDPSYMKRAKELSNIFRDAPEKPLERAVFWTEYVLRHKGAYHLQSGAIQLNTIQYYCVDVVIFLVGTAFLIILASVSLIKRLVNLMLRSLVSWKVNRGHGSRKQEGKKQR